MERWGEKTQIIALEEFLWICVSAPPLSVCASHCPGADFLNKLSKLQWSVCSRILIIARVQSPYKERILRLTLSRRFAVGPAERSQQSFQGHCGWTRGVGRCQRAFCSILFLTSCRGPGGDVGSSSNPPEHDVRGLHFPSLISISTFLCVPCLFLSLPFLFRFTTRRYLPTCAAYRG